MDIPIVFDIETTDIPITGIFDIEKIHCIAAKNCKTGERFFFTDVKEGAQFLSSATVLIGHNIIGFDIPVIQKFTSFNFEKPVVDTLVMARAIWPNIMEKDFKNEKSCKLPRRLFGSHSLEAYGYRLSILKGDYKFKKDAWKTLNSEMKEYCQQDVEVTHALYKQVIKSSTELMVNLENDFARIVMKQVHHGVLFDTEKAIELMLLLREKKKHLIDELQRAFPPIVIPGDTQVAARKNKTYPGLEKGISYSKFVIEEFNPSSRQQIIKRLSDKYGWEPIKLTEKGSPIADESVLKELVFPEAELLLSYLMVDKRLAQLADGRQAWMKKTVNNRIHGSVNTAGAISGRCTHSNPNLAQVPAVNAEFGAECRELFTVPEGYKLVGCDASGLELRCLAHYLAKYDGGEYAQLVLHGDIHTANQKAAGLPERNMAKTFIYGWLYGAGPDKIGLIVGGGRKEGERLQKQFLKSFPAIAELKSSVAEVVQRKGGLRGLDGRFMVSRSQHSALNLLLQGAGALVMKQALIECDKLAREAELNYAFVLNIHDEWQAEVLEKDAEEFGGISVKAIRKAGEFFNFRIPLDGEYKIGNNWKETH